MKTQSNRLTFSQQFFIATMLFGLFFGAGNLIFPIFWAVRPDAMYGPPSSVC